MKQRQNERERIEKQLSKLPKQSGDDDNGLRVNKYNVFFSFYKLYFHFLVANQLMSKNLFTKSFTMIFF